MGIPRINLYSRKNPLFQWGIQLGQADMVRQRSSFLSLNLFAYIRLRSQAKAFEVPIRLSVFSRRIHQLLMSGKTYSPLVPLERTGMPFQLRAAQRAVSDPLRSAKMTQWEAETVRVRFLGGDENHIEDQSFVQLRQVNTSTCMDPPVTGTEDTFS